MPYYPKSQIVTDLYTNGDEYFLSTNREEYIGYYYELSNGKKYTGKNPNEQPNILLDLQPDPSHQAHIGANEDDSKVDTTIFYPKTDVSTDVFLPQFNTPLPTKDEYASGNFTRYFCKKTNELKYLEITQETYTRLFGKSSDILWSLYDPFKIPWKITQNVSQNYETNRQNTENIVRKLNLDRFVEALRINYSQYSPTTTQSTISPSSTINNGGTSSGGVSGGGTSGGGGY